MPYTKLVNPEDVIKAIVEEGKHDFFIFNGFKSSKFIDVTDEGNIHVYNEIDDSEDIFTKEEFIDWFNGYIKTNWKFYSYD